MLSTTCQVKNGLNEDAPVNSAGGGNVAGLGVGAKGEPPKVKRGKFAGNDTFILRRQKYNDYLGRSKKDRQWWKTYIGEDDDALEEVRQYARKNPKSAIVFEDEDTGSCFFARYGKKR